MIIMELFDQAPAGYYSEKKDQSVLKFNKKRSTRLTLGHINSMRISHDIRKIEHEEKLKALPKQYAPQPEGGGGLGGL
jgi:hypothetical protein